MKQKLKNYLYGIENDGRASILRITQDCEVVDGKGVVGNEHPLNKYYDYGIKNSLGMNLILYLKIMDTENDTAFVMKLIMLNHNLTVD